MERCCVHIDRRMHASMRPADSTTANIPTEAVKCYHVSKRAMTSDSRWFYLRKRRSHHLPQHIFLSLGSSGILMFSTTRNSFWICKRLCKTELAKKRVESSEKEKKKQSRSDIQIYFRWFQGQTYSYAFLIGYAKDGSQAGFFQHEKFWNGIQQYSTSQLWKRYKSNMSIPVEMKITEKICCQYKKKKIDSPLHKKVHWNLIRDKLIQEKTKLSIFDIIAN